MFTNRLANFIRLTTLSAVVVLSITTNAQISREDPQAGDKIEANKVIVSELANLLTPVPNLIFAQRYCDGCSVLIHCPITDAAAFHYDVSCHAIKYIGNSATQNAANSSTEFVLSTAEAIAAFRAMRGTGHLNYWITRKGSVSYGIKIILSMDAEPVITITNTETSRTLMELKRKIQLQTSFAGKEQNSARLLAYLGTSIPMKVTSKAVKISLTTPCSWNKVCDLTYRLSFSTTHVQPFRAIPERPSNVSCLFHSLASLSALKSISSIAYDCSVAGRSFCKLKAETK